MKSANERISTPAGFLTGSSRILMGYRTVLSGLPSQNRPLLPALALPSIALPSMALLVTLLALFVGGCARSQDQVDFEQQAYRTPQNYTETTPNGEVVRRDEDDWRIGPMFQGFVEMQIPPHPNPTRGEPVRIELIVTGVGTVNGLRAISYFDMFDERSILTHYIHDRSPLDFGTLIFNIYPAEFDPGRNYSNARSRNDGLHRLFIYDDRWNLITYGDIKLK